MLGALKMQRRLNELISEGKMPPLRTRYGLNYGTAIVGNTGSASRFDYTASGDAINLASRLEGLNKHFGTSILLSDDASRELNGKFPLLELGRVKVYGKSRNTTIYTVIENSPEPSDLQVWKEGVRHFQKREWDPAEEKFSKVQSVPVLSGIARWYLTVLRKYRQNPPEDSWDGEIALMEK